MKSKIGRIFLTAMMFSIATITHGANTVEKENETQAKVKKEVIKSDVSAISWQGKQFLQWCDPETSQCTRVKMSDKIGSVNFVAPGKLLAGVKASWLAVATPKIEGENADEQESIADKGFLCALTERSSVACAPIHAPLPSNEQLQIIAASANFSDFPYVELPSLNRSESQTSTAFHQAIGATKIEFQQQVDSKMNSSKPGFSTMAICELNPSGDSCKDACDRAYYEFTVVCNHYRSAATRASCHAYNSELYASCLSSCP